MFIFYRSISSVSGHVHGFHLQLNSGLETGLRPGCRTEFWKRQRSKEGHATVDDDDCGVVGGGDDDDCGDRN